MSKARVFGTYRPRLNFAPLLLTPGLAIERSASPLAAHEAVDGPPVACEVLLHRDTGGVRHTAVLLVGAPPRNRGGAVL